MEAVRERGRVIALAVIMVLALAAGVAGWFTSSPQPNSSQPAGASPSP